MKKQYHFFAMASRMKHINRWGLMRNTHSESLSEHSHETAVLAHALAILENSRFGGDYDPDHAAAMALFHDTTEIITGDLPTPVKYYSAEASLRGALQDCPLQSVAYFCEHFLPSYSLTLDEQSSPEQGF